jgi:LysR family hca operon transcriptional activator
LWLPHALRIIREEAPGVEIIISGQPSPQLALALMRGKIDVAFIRRETQTVGLSFRFLTKEPLIAILPADHRLASRKKIRPQHLACESFISVRRGLAPVLQSVIDDYAATVGITLKAAYEAETLSGTMSLVASTGGVTLFPLSVQNLLTPNVVARPLEGKAPTIDLMLGYNKTNSSP